MTSNSNRSYFRYWSEPGVPHNQRRPWITSAENREPQTFDKFIRSLAGHSMREVPSTSMPVSVKVYCGKGKNLEIRRFTFRQDNPRKTDGIFPAMVHRIRLLYNGLSLRDVNLCWRDDDGDYIVFSSDDELKVALNSVTDSTLRIYVREKDPPKGDHPERPSTSHDTVFEPSPRAHRRQKVELYRSTSRPRPRPKEIAEQLASLSISVESEQPMVTAPDSPLNNHVASDSGTQSAPVSNDPAIYNHVNDTTGGASSAEPRYIAGASSEPRYDTNSSRGYNSAPTSARVISCSECLGEGRGVWYKCTVCSSYLLCSDCENNGLHDQHPMVRVKIVPATATEAQHQQQQNHSRNPR